MVPAADPELERLHTEVPVQLAGYPAHEGNAVGDGAGEDSKSLGFSPRKSKIFADRFERPPADIVLENICYLY